MSKLKIRPNYVLAHVVRGRRKFKGLYTPQKKAYSDFFDLVPIYIAQIGDECKIKSEGVTVGAKCFIVDAFELEPLPMAEGLDYPVPDECWREAEDGDGYVEFNILHEDSIIGVAE